MKKVLVIGGTQFFGKKTVELLLEKGHEVTIATRGNRAHPFGNNVEHILLDARDKNHKGWIEVANQQWEAVFHNVCYTKEDAELLIEKLTGLTEHVYFTSSLSVYLGEKDGYSESDFDPLTYEIDASKEVTYGEGKRQAEVVLFTQAPFHVTAFRFPIVLDVDDHTKRFHYYIEKGLKDETIYLENVDYKINFVKGSAAAESIVWAIENEKSGIYNISSRDAITLDTLMLWIEEGIGKELIVKETGQPAPSSPFSISHHWYLLSYKIEEEGFPLLTSAEWMKPLIEELKEQIGQN